MRDPKTPVARLKNVGPKSARLLEEIGIHTLADLEKVGSVFAYRILRHRFSGVTLNMLYGLEATLRDIHWLELTPEDKAGLRNAAGDELRIGR